MNITNTKVSVHNIRVYDKMVTASARKGKKVNEEWQSLFYNVKFVGKCLDQAKTLQDKYKIEIKSAVYEPREWVNEDGEKRKAHDVIVFEFESIGQANTNNDDFFVVENPDDLPF